jgi:hypothetical protein
MKRLAYQITDKFSEVPKTGLNLLEDVIGRDTGSALLAPQAALVASRLHGIKGLRSLSPLTGRVGAGAAHIAGKYPNVAHDLNHLSKWLQSKPMGIRKGFRGRGGNLGLTLAPAAIVATIKALGSLRDSLDYDPSK